MEDFEYSEEPFTVYKATVNYGGLLKMTTFSNYDDLERFSYELPEINYKGKRLISVRYNKLGVNQLFKDEGYKYIRDNRLERYK